MANNKRPYDLVLFGCTGDAGRAVAAFFGKHAGGTTWALAGRNAKKLEALRASDAALARVPLVVADVGDAASMDAMAKSCDLVVSAAGPYALLGEAVVRACVDHGTHYLDVTGEVHWVAEMATKYAGAATASCLASFGGYDCVPDEATVFAVSRAIGEPLAAAESVVDYGLEAGGPRGTILTVLGLFGDPLRAARGWHAYMGLGKGCRTAALRDLVYWGLPSFSSTLDCFTVPNFMGAIQIPVVHRSGHDNGYVLDSFRFKDRMVLPGARSLLTGKGALLYYAFVAFLFLATPAFLVLAVLVRAPPVERAARRLLEARSYGGSRAPTIVVTTTGHGAAGASATATLRVRGDAGIVATAALCGEVALAMVEAAAAGGLKAGFTTPVGALGDALLARLEQSETMSLVVAKEA